MGFIPLVADECFDLATTRRDYFETPVQFVPAFTRSKAFARRATHLGGYDVTDLGKVLWHG